MSDVDIPLWYFGEWNNAICLGVVSTMRGLAGVCSEDMALAQGQFQVCTLHQELFLHATEGADQRLKLGKQNDIH